MTTPQDTDDLLFWQEIRQAYDLVAVNNERTIELARNNKVATVWLDSDEDVIFIQINNAVTQVKEALIVP